MARVFKDANGVTMPVRMEPAPAQTLPTAAEQVPRRSKTGRGGLASTETDRNGTERTEPHSGRKPTAKQYPSFDFDAEFANAKFRAALDYVAAQNEEKNRANGTAGEVFDVTFAYELAHADELRANQIKRVSKATASAVAQTMQANRERPRENALRTGAPSKVSTYQTMSDKDFDDYLEKVRRREAKI